MAKAVERQQRARGDLLTVEILPGLFVLVTSQNKDSNQLVTFGAVACDLRFSPLCDLI
jgi:hypothetical protein